MFHSFERSVPLLKNLCLSETKAQWTSVQLGLHREKTETYRVMKEWHIVCISSLALICDCQVKCPTDLFSLRIQVVTRTQGCFQHTLHQIRSITVLKHSEQAGSMGFRNDGVVPDPQQIKNPIDWDFRILVALCPGLCHRFFIRLLAIVTLVYGFSVSSLNVSHAVQLLDLCFSSSYGRWQLRILLPWCCIHSNTIAMEWGPYARRNFIIRVSRQKFWFSSTWHMTGSVTC